MRAFILEALYEWSKAPYQKYFKGDAAWQLTANDLLRYPEQSLGFHLGCFLLKHHFEIQPKLESHDVFHVLTGTGTSVPEEVSMQYYLWGNGKRSAYLVAVVVLGTLLYPDEIKRFIRAFRKGKRALPFHQLHFFKLLGQPINSIKTAFAIQ
ncbi:Coq4 family protein [Maribacter sp. 2-571]|uniref:Coq4 family protein n=1 Tax=Maribacter sp. 2-571 TaxID=3417569 RepID=UPI003D33414F